MLHAVAREHPGGAVIHVDGQRDGHGAFGELKAGAFVLRNLPVFGHQVELLTRHAKSRVIVDLHGGTLIRPGTFVIEYQKTAFKF
jgi:hypothetical protein